MKRVNPSTAILFAAVAGLMIYVALSTADWRWQDAARWGWLPGTLEGVIGGTFGGVAGILAPKGRGRKFIMPWCILLCASSVGMLIGGIVHLLTGRGWYVWYPWLLPGVLGSILFPVLLPVFHRCYQEAEMRRLSATDISCQ